MRDNRGIAYYSVFTTRRLLLALIIIYFNKYTCL